MRKSIVSIQVVLLTLALVFSGMIMFKSTALAASKPVLSRTKTTLYVGDSETLDLLGITSVQAKKVVWSTSKKAVVTVKKGKITAKKAGKANVSAKLGNKKYTCKVTVKKPVVKYVEAENPADEGNQIYQKDVTKEMTSPSFWYNKVSNPDKVLLSYDDIVEQNNKNYAAGNGMTDLKKVDASIDGAQVRENLSAALMKEVRQDRIGTRTVIYRNGQALDASAMDTWFAEMKKNIDNAQALDSRKYAICVKRADLWMAPTSDLIGWSETDADSEFINSSMNVNEPVIIDLITSDGKFCHVTSNNCAGWVETDHFAICSSKEEWLAQWDLSGDNVLVVTGSHITLEQSNLAPKTSELDLYLGTQLPLVPSDALPNAVAERYPWYSYCVYIPTRDESGHMVREVAMISSHHSVCVGFQKLTVKNIIKDAYSCLGDRYGWGGMLGSMDCSLYVRNIYRCFGMEIPRNTSWQAAMDAYRVDLTAMNDEAKVKAIKKLSPGSLLMFSGHITLYLGEEGGKYYVISDLGSLYENDAETTLRSVYSVCINSLDVKRRNGNTWLAEMKWAITPFVPAA